MDIVKLRSENNLLIERFFKIQECVNNIQNYQIVYDERWLKLTLMVKDDSGELFYSKEDYDFLFKNLNIAQPILSRLIISAITEQTSLGSDIDYQWSEIGKAVSSICKNYTVDFNQSQPCLKGWSDKELEGIKVYFKNCSFQLKHSLQQINFFAQKLSDHQIYLMRNANLFEPEFKGYVKILSKEFLSKSIGINQAQILVSNLNEILSLSVPIDKPN